MNQNETRKLLTLLTSCTNKKETLIQTAMSYLDGSIEQQILRRLNQYPLPSLKAQKSKKKLEKFKYDTSSLTALFSSHKQLQEMIQQSEIPFKELLIGKYILFGKYNNEPILWQVIDVDSQGNVFLLSHDIITFKCFHLQDGLFTNDWNQSTIREWLNSDKMRVKYSAGSPNENKVWNGINPYSKEKGFLANGNFNDFERSLLITYKRKKDLVSFLSLKEANDFVLRRGLNINAQPTKNAIEQSTHSFEFLQNPTGWCYFLQDSVPKSSHLVYIINAEGKISTGFSYDGTIGIRPTIALSSNATFKGKGTLANPLEIVRG